MDHQAPHHPSNISSHKYTQDKIATLKMVDLSCRDTQPKIATVKVDIIETRKENKYLHLVPQDKISRSEIAS
jgi:hypothetical protein